MISSLGGTLKTYQTVFGVFLSLFVWQVKNKVAKMIKDRDVGLENLSISNVIEVMETRFHIANIFIKLGLVDKIQNEVDDQRE